MTKRRMLRLDVSSEDLSKCLSHLRQAGHHFEVANRYLKSDVLSKAIKLIDRIAYNPKNLQGSSNDLYNTLTYIRNMLALNKDKLHEKKLQLQRYLTPAELVRVAGEYKIGGLELQTAIIIVK